MPRVNLLILEKSDGICNLCRRAAALTGDHIPPKSCGNVGYTHITRLLGPSLKDHTPTKRRHNGIVYRTLCLSCNQALGHYDWALKEFYARVRAACSSQIFLPTSLEIPIAGAALKSIVGHFVAARLLSSEPEFEPALRSFALGQNTLDPKLLIYYWVYPYFETVVARDFVFMDPSSVGNNQLRQLAGVASVMKFRPLAFMIVYGRHTLSLPTLNHVANIGDHNYGYASLDFSRIQHQTWPERPWKLEHVVLAGAEFQNATSSFSGKFGEALMRQLAREDQRAIDVGWFQSLSNDPAFARSAWLVDRRDDPRRKWGLA